MRNDIAFLEAAYAAMRLGAYGVPVNWHFKPEEINYVLKDSGTAVLIGHADLLHPLRAVIPAGVTVLGVPTPQEILRSYSIDPDHLVTPDFAVDLEPWLERQRPYDGPGGAAAAKHDLHLRHHWKSQGSAAAGADAGTGAGVGTDARAALWPGAGRAGAAPGAAGTIPRRIRSACARDVSAARWC